MTVRPRLTIPNDGYGVDHPHQRSDRLSGHPPAFGGAMGCLNCTSETDLMSMSCQRRANLGSEESLGSLFHKQRKRSWDLPFGLHS